jgi:hypothetical protein
MAKQSKAQKDRFVHCGIVPQPLNVISYLAIWPSTGCGQSGNREQYFFGLGAYKDAEKAPVASPVTQIRTRPQVSLIHNSFFTLPRPFSLCS